MLFYKKGRKLFCLPRLKFEVVTSSRNIKKERELVGNQTAQIQGAGGPVGRRSFFKNGKANSKSETHGRVIRIESGDIQAQSGARSGEFPVAFSRLFIFDKNLSMVDESIKR